MGPFHITWLNDNVLRIDDPPDYYMGVFFIGVNVLCLLFLIGSLGAWLAPPGQIILFEGKPVDLKQNMPWGWKGNLIAAVVTFVSAAIVYFSWQPSSLVLDREAGTCTVDNGHLPFSQDLETYYLRDVAYSTLETDGGAVRFVIVLQGGHRIGLGGYTDQPNQSEAVDAANQFLQVSQPGEPAHE